MKWFISQGEARREEDCVGGVFWALMQVVFNSFDLVPCRRPAARPDVPSRCLFETRHLGCGICISCACSIFVFWCLAPEDVALLLA